MIVGIARSKPLRRVTGALLGSVMLSGCATHAPDASYVVRQPSQTPIQTTTNFTESLRCMDEMFLRRGFTYGLTISSVGVPDKTNKIFAGNRAMLIAAISAMSLRSGAFKYVDNNVDLKDEIGGLQPLASGLFVTGSISELDQGITNDTTGGGVTIAPVFGLGVNKQQMTSTMGVDMMLGDIATRVILPGTSVSNTLTFALRSKGADLDARVSSGGLDYSVNVSESEGSHAALRALIELSTIEMLGRYAKVPYWQCLGIVGTDPRARKAAYDQYSSMRDDQRAAFVSAELTSAGYYHGPAVRTLTPDLRAAAGRYEQDNGQPALGLMTFELYYALMSASNATAAPPSQAVPAAELPSPAGTVPRAVAPAVFLSRDPATADRAYLGEPQRFTVDLSQDGYLACFYQDGDGKVFRTYPNPTQPSEFVAANRKIQIPGPNDFFHIRPTTPNTIEYFACFSSSRSVLGALPGNVSQSALAVLPVTNLNDIVKDLQTALGASLYSQFNSYTVVPRTP